MPLNFARFCESVSDEKFVRAVTHEIAVAATVSAPAPKV